MQCSYVWGYWCITTLFVFGFGTITVLLIVNQMSSEKRRSDESIADIAYKRFSHGEISKSQFNSILNAAKKKTKGV